MKKMTKKEQQKRQKADQKRAAYTKARLQKKIAAANKPSASGESTEG